KTIENNQDKLVEDFEKSEIIPKPENFAEFQLYSPISVSNWLDKISILKDSYVLTLIGKGQKDLSYSKFLFSIILPKDHFENPATYPNTIKSFSCQNLSNLKQLVMYSLRIDRKSRDLMVILNFNWFCINNCAL